MDFRIDRKGVVRFFRYAGVGGSTFAFDLLILWLMTEFMGIPYYVSTPLAFVIAVSLNYFASRLLVFKGTERRVDHGYAYFITVAGGGAFLITASVAFLTETFLFHYLVARVLVACVVGILNYLFNLHFNFKVVGRHH
jgi:putative flippase GtrA